VSGDVPARASAGWEPVLGAAASAAAPATRIVLVRHGETDWNARGVYQGWQDVPLGASGRVQAEELARWLAEIAIDAAYTSPLARARETAAIVLAGRGVVPLALPALRELSYGRAEGVAPDERRAAWPDLDARWADDPWEVALPDGESLDLLAARVLPAWERIVLAHPGETVLVSAHGHVNRVILLHVRRLPRAAFWSVAQPNGSAILLECAPATAVVGSAA
jgi:broad specificity phosphatase PhoE